MFCVMLCDVATKCAYCCYEIYVMLCKILYDFYHIFRLKCVIMNLPNFS